MSTTLTMSMEFQEKIMTIQIQNTIVQILKVFLENIKDLVQEVYQNLMVLMTIWTCTTTQIEILSSQNIPNLETDLMKIQVVIMITLFIRRQ